MVALRSVPGHGNILSALFLLAMLLAWFGAGVLAAPVDDTILCSDTVSPLEKNDGSEKMPSDCLLTCTAQTFGRMVQSKDRQTVRFKPSDKEEMGEYCWSRHLNCNAGESLTHVYIIMPTNTSVVSEEGPLLSIISGTHREALKPHGGGTALADECGLRYDVMEYFARGRSDAMLCLKMNDPEGILMEDLRCPPFLVSVWINNNLPPISLGTE